MTLLRCGLLVGDRDRDLDLDLDLDRDRDWDHDRSQGQGRASKPQVVRGLGHADGVLPSAHVPRPCPPCRPGAVKAGKASSLTSLRGAHHRRGPSAAMVSVSARRFGHRVEGIGWPAQRSQGGGRAGRRPARPGDMSGGGYPVASARAPGLSPGPEFGPLAKRGPLPELSTPFQLGSHFERPRTPNFFLFPNPGPALDFFQYRKPPTQQIASNAAH